MVILELDTVLVYKKYKGQTVEQVIQFHFNYIIWLIKNREEIVLRDQTLDFLFQWSRGLKTGKTFINHIEELEIRNLIKYRWAVYEYEINKSDQLQDEWHRNREIDKDNRQAYEP